MIQTKNDGKTCFLLLFSPMMSQKYYLCEQKEQEKSMIYLPSLICLMGTVR